MPIELHLEPLVSHRTAQTDILERITLRAIYDAYERTTCSLVAEWKFTTEKKTPVQLILYIKMEFDVVLPPALHPQDAATLCTIYTAS
jgi:hypothetical protein